MWSNIIHEKDKQLEDYKKKKALKEQGNLEGWF